MELGKNIRLPTRPIIILASLVGLLVPACQHSERTPPSLPNIVIILADDMGYGDIAALNPGSRIQTPALDWLAEEGVVFSNAHASASVCTPSRYGLLTGRYAFRSERAAYGVNGFAKPVIEPGRQTIASVLKKAGYTTACIGKWHLGLGWETHDGSNKAMLDVQSGRSNVDYHRPVSNGPNDYGFDYSFIHPASLDMPPYMFLRNHMAIDTAIVLNTDHYPIRKQHTEFAWDRKHTEEYDIYWEKGLWWRRGEMARSFRVEDCHDEILKEAVSFIDNQAEENSGTPFLLYLPLTGPHTPWLPSSKFIGKSEAGLYGDFVMEMDDAVDRIVKTLEKHDLMENTLLIFTSDNGAYWPQEEIDRYGHDSSYGRRGQKGDIWEGGHRVPLIVNWPAEIDGRMTNSNLVSLTDIFATLTELAQVEKEEGEDSFSFLHAVLGDSQTPIRPSMVHHSSRGMYGIRSGDWKYIADLGSGGFTEPYTEEEHPDGPQGQLYQLSTDSLEQQNLYLQNPEQVAALRRRLNAISDKK